MDRFLKTFLISSIVLFAACASDYKGLQNAVPDKGCIERVSPKYIETSWYTASVDVVGRHLSGLLLIKHMPDSSYRVVFTNEAGITFFNFEFAGDGSFKAHYVLDKLNKKPVIETLRKDFALLLGWPFRMGGIESRRQQDEWYFGVKQKKETAYFITGKDCASL